MSCVMSEVSGQSAQLHILRVCVCVCVCVCVGGGGLIFKTPRAVLYM